MYGLSQAVLTCLPPELKGARLFPDKCRGGGEGGGHRKEACTHTTHSRVEAGVGYRCQGLTRGSQDGGPATGRLVYRQETHNTSTLKSLGTNSVMQQRGHANADSCVLYTQIYTQARIQRLQRRAQTCSHTRTRTNTHAHAPTHKGFRSRCARPNPGGRERV